MPEPADDAIRKLWERTIRDESVWQTGDPTLTYKPVSADGPQQSSLDPSAFLADQSVAQHSGGEADVQETYCAPALADDFDLLEKIGEGGMGVIWRAHQKSLARDVALKQAKTDGPGAEARALARQFLAEARVTGFLDHPNIVPVHALGRDAQGQLFLSMKLVQGTSWRDLLHPWTPELRAKAKHLDLEAHLATLMSVGNAVAFAHSRNVAHLDLKPANIMVGDFGEVLLMDWGIAVDIGERTSEAAESARPGRTRHHTAVLSPAGTPAYIAPEMAEGRGGEIGPWTDVYLLGAILHEIITGEPPHRGASISAVLMAASRSGPKDYAPDVPPALVDICRKAMSREIAERYQTVGRFQSALQSFLKYRESMQIADRASAQLEKLAGADTRYRDAAKRYEVYADAVSRYRQALELWQGNEVAREGLRKTAFEYARSALAAGDIGLAQAQLEILPPDDGEATRLRSDVDKAAREALLREQTARRMRTTLISLASAIFLGITISFFWIRSERDVARRREREANDARIEVESKRRAAVRQRERIEREAEKSQAVVGFLQQMLSSADPARDGRDVRVVDLLDKTDEQLKEAFEKQPEIRAAIRHTVASSLLCLGEYDRARAHFQKAFATRAKHLGAEHPDTLDSRYGLATTLWKIGEHAEAEAMLRKVTSARAKVLGADHRDTLRAKNALAVVLMARGEYADSEKLLSECLDAQQRVLGMESRDTLDTMFNLVAALRCQNKNEEADAMLSRLLEAELDAFAAEKPSMILSREKLDSALTIQRKLVEAQGDIRQWLFRIRKDRSATERDFNSIDNLASVLKTLGKGGESARICRDIIAVRARLMGEDHPSTIHAMHDLGNALLAQRLYDEAAEALHGVVAAARKVLGPDHPDTLVYECSYASALAATGKREEAVTLLRATLEKQQAALGADHPDVIHSREVLKTIESGK